MTVRLGRLVSVAVLAMSAGFLAVRLALVGVVPPDPDEEGDAVLLAPVAAFSLVGLLILWHRPHHAIGWIYVLTGFALTLSGALQSYERATHLRADVLPLGGAAGSLADLAFLTALLLPVTFGLLLFPDGRLPSPRWRTVGWLAVAFVATIFLGDTLTQRRSEGIGGVLTPIGLIGIAAVAAAAVYSLVVRWRRSAALERQQLKYVLVAIAFLAIAFLGIVATTVLEVEEPAASLSWVGFLIGLVIVPVSVGLAILRYRLYEIDLFIKRTVVYGATSAAIAVTFFVGIVALQSVLRPITSGSELSVAASTLASFALFQPIRRRVQDAVDRRFDRSRYDAWRTLDAFADQLRDEVDLDALRSDLLGAVKGTMAPAHSSLWLRERTARPRSLGGP